MQARCRFGCTFSTQGIKIRVPHCPTRVTLWQGCTATGEFDNFPVEAIQSGKLKARIETADNHSCSSPPDDTSSDID